MRIVSHRARGFGAAENTLEAFSRALSRARVVEIDTRVLADGVLVVRHNRHLLDKAGRATPLDRLNFEDLRSLDATIAPLEAFLDVFKREADVDAELMVDLRGMRGVASLLKSLRDRGLEQRTWLLSWRPDVLLAAAGADAPVRLGFNHIALKSALLHGLVIAGTRAPAQRLIRACVTPFNACYAADLTSISVHIQAHDTAHDAADVDVCVVRRGKEDGQLRRCLIERAGMVCLPLNTHPTIVEAYKQDGIGIGLFTALDRRGVDDARARGANYVFVDDASLIEPTKTQRLVKERENIGDQ